MNVSVQLERNEVAGLENVAEGRVAAVPEEIVSRLLAMGMVQKAHDDAGRGVTLQLTSKGLSFIRSSDQ